MTTRVTISSLFAKNTAYGFLLGSLFSFLSLHLAEGLGESGITAAMTRPQYGIVLSISMLFLVVGVMGYYFTRHDRRGV